MEITLLQLSGLQLITMPLFRDERGFFTQSFHKEQYAEAGLDLAICQHNQSRSRKGVVRGLHFQYDSPLSKLVRVTHGKALFVAVDIRKNSPTRGQWESRELSLETGELLWVPFGFATGFCALEDDTDMEYYFNNFYNKAGESNIRWNDPELAIAWPISSPIVSARDAGAQTFAEWRSSPLSDKVG
ncbi:MAG: dTDP-4-dehydrorhamnose 3,5-epimerase [Candidatus Pacebacteria bacterium]|nr:dTDP-4-dehydrorhamnose 3,5-epimerase [Candidatus Paceibacterota bacterium]